MEWEETVSHIAHKARHTGYVMAMTDIVRWLNDGKILTVDGLDLVHKTQELVAKADERLRES